MILSLVIGGAVDAALAHDVEDAVHATLHLQAVLGLGDTLWVSGHICGVCEVHLLNEKS